MDGRVGFKLTVKDLHSFTLPLGYLPKFVSIIDTVPIIYYG